MFLASNICWVSSGTVRARNCWRSTGGQGSEADHEEVETGEGDHVDSQFAEISVQLTRETQTGGDAGHDDGHQVVQVTVGGGGELQSAEANVVEGLVVNAEGLVGVLDQLVDGEGGVVRLNDSVGHL